MTNTFLVDSVGGISGSLTTLVDGSSYLIAGTGIDIASGSNGSVTVSAVTGSAPTMAYGQINIFNNASSTGPSGPPGSSGGVYPITGTWLAGIAPNSISYDLTNGFMSPSTNGVFEITCQTSVTSPIESYAGNPQFEWVLYRNGAELTASLAKQNAGLDGQGNTEYSTVTFGGIFSLNAADQVQPKVGFASTIAILTVTYANFYMRQIV